MNPSNPTNPINLPRALITYGFPLLLIFAICYHSTLTWMYGRYISSDSYYSHGFIIPFVSAFLIWQKRSELKVTAVDFSWWGLILIIASVLIHIAGTILYVFSISGFSIFFLVSGTSLFLFGKNITRIIIFPLIFLIFMFPLPMAFISAISFPMKILVAKTGTGIVSLLGIPVIRDGFNITIPNGSLLVGNPCSGLRSLISFLALGAIFAYLINILYISKLILFVSAIPIALLSNIVRVPILILISHYWGIESAAPETFWHDASGIFVFVIGFIMLFAIGRLLEWKK